MVSQRGCSSYVAEYYRGAIARHLYKIDSHLASSAQTQASNVPYVKARELATRDHNCEVGNRKIGLLNEPQNI
jgi:hypothetical protein